MRYYEKFAAYYKSDVPKCPNGVIAKAVKEACIEWCRSTRAIIAIADNISLIADKSEYEVNFTSDLYEIDGEVVEVDGEPVSFGGDSTGMYYPISIDNAYLGDGSNDDTRLTVTSKRRLDVNYNNWHVRTTTSNPTHIFLMKNNFVRVYPTPESNVDDALRLSFVVVPTRESTGINDIIYEDHVEDIRNGVLMRLFGMAGRPWYFPQGELDYKFKWSVSKANGRADVLKGKSDLDVVANYSGSNMF